MTEPQLLSTEAGVECSGAEGHTFDVRNHL